MKLDSARLQIAMARVCMNAYDVAKKAGIHYATIKRACTRTGAKPTTIGKIARALGVDVVEIIEDS